MDEYHIEYDLNKKSFSCFTAFLSIKSAARTKPRHVAHKKSFLRRHFSRAESRSHKTRTSRQGNKTARTSSLLEPGVVFLPCLPPFSMSHLLTPNPPSAPPPTTTSTTTTSRTTLHRSSALTIFTIAESSTRPLSHGCAQQPTKLKSPAHKQQLPFGAPYWYSGERRWQVCAVTYAGRMRAAGCRLCAASGRI
jgi:hypothetical protein